MSSPSFIVLDGPDGSGKSLHARLLADRLQENGTDVIFTEEPTRGPIGACIRTFLHGENRAHPAALQLLFTADRAWHEETVILPALQAGKTVVCDRYASATIAYGTALGLDEQWLKDLNKKFVRPDCLIFTLPPLEICLRRLSRRAKRDLLEASDLQESIHRAYRKLADEDSSIIVLDTSGTKESVAEDIWKKLRALRT